MTHAPATVFPPRLRRFAALLPFLVLALAGPTRADIPPPKGYVETCTPERACAGRAAVSCRGSFRDADGCQKQFEPQGLVRACRTRGASVWTEVWCKPAPGSAPAPAASEAARAASRTPAPAAIPAAPASGPR
ncbi:MAG: hypothetical protein JNN18_05025 [Rubrivivax sp.]|nr:hypothetical protein [Rubrivivax sp.]